MNRRRSRGSRPFIDRNELMKNVVLHKPTTSFSSVGDRRRSITLTKHENNSDLLLLATIGEMVDKVESSKLGEFQKTSILETLVCTSELISSLSEQYSTIPSEILLCLSVFVGDLHRLLVDSTKEKVRYGIFQDRLSTLSPTVSTRSYYNDDIFKFNGTDSRNSMTQPQMDEGSESEFEDEMTEIYPSNSNRILSHSEFGNGNINHKMERNLDRVNQRNQIGRDIQRSECRDQINGEMYNRSESRNINKDIIHLNNTNFNPNMNHFDNINQNIQGQNRINLDGRGLDQNGFNQEIHPDEKYHHHIHQDHQRIFQDRYNQNINQDRQINPDRYQGKQRKQSRGTHEYPANQGINHPARDLSNYITPTKKQSHRKSMEFNSQNMYAESMDSAQKPSRPQSMYSFQGNGKSFTPKNNFRNSFLPPTNNGFS
jgi:hypothetical protein